MPDNKNQGQKNQNVGNAGQGNIGRDKDENQGRQQQGNKGQQQGGNKGSTNAERDDDMRQVGNDNNLDREEDKVTSRHPRMDDQGQRQDRGGNADRDRNNR
jgi:hypothetical protein